MSTELVVANQNQPSTNEGSLTTGKLQAIQLQALARVGIVISNGKSIASQIKAALRDKKDLSGAALQDEYRTIVRETLAPQAAALAQLATAQGWLIEYNFGKPNAKSGEINRFTVTYTRPKAVADKLTKAEVAAQMARFCKTPEDRKDLLTMLRKQGLVSDQKVREIEAEVLAPAVEATEAA